jgi:hypothetical protein
MIHRVRDLCRSAQETLTQAAATEVPSEEASQALSHALDLAHQAVELADSSLGEGSYGHLQAMVIQGGILKEAHKISEARSVFAQVEAGLLRLSQVDPDGAIHILGRLVIWYHELGDTTKSQLLLAQLKSFTKAAYGPDHPRYLMLEVQGHEWLAEGRSQPFGLWHF